MYKQILQSIDGIGIFPVISLIMFFLFFAAMLIWLFKGDQNYFRRMGRLPLESTEPKKYFTGDYNEN